MYYDEAYRFLTGNLKPRKLEVEKVTNEGYDPNVVPAPCDSFQHLVEVCGEKLTMTPGMVDTLAVMLAVNLSLKLKDVPVWTYVIGPPSSGKTTLADIISASHPYCHSVSKITGIFSGFRSPAGDASLMKSFQGKTIMMKDFTSILKMPTATQDTIFSELRELFDGSANVAYRNKVAYNYSDVNFAIVACVTDEIRAFSQTELGERFLSCEIDSHWSQDGFMTRYSSGSDEILDRALSNVLQAIYDPNGAEAAKLIPQKCHTFGLLESLHQSMGNDPTLAGAIAQQVEGNQHFMRLVANLARWVSFARANVHRDRSQGLLYRPRAEIGLRLGKQLAKLAVSLCMLFNIMEPNDDVDRIVRKVALDTALNFQLEIMLALSHCTNDIGFTTRDLSQALGLTQASVVRHVNDMRELKILTEKTVPSNQGQGGRPSINYTLSDELNGLAKALSFR